MLIDTHAHLDFPEFADDLVSVLARARDRGVEEIVSIGIDLPSSEKAAALAGDYPGIYATVGVHPHGAHELSPQTLVRIEDVAGNDLVVAIGEIGLDYYRDRQPRPVQRRCLEQQIDLACALRLPAVFHIRDAFDDFFKVIGGYHSRLTGGILHCFSGDWAVAEACLEMGFYLSIPGTVTFPKAQIQQEVVRRTPLDRLLVETDAPYLAPVPYRGKVNEPAFVVYTAEKIAELKGCTLEEVGRRTTLNARTVFKLPAAHNSGNGPK
jgi:TatD DNase family protein